MAYKNGYAKGYADGKAEKGKTMEDNGCVKMDYEACYTNASAELKKAIDENHYLRDELRQKEREMSWHYGFKEAVELIFRGKNNA